MKTLLSATRRTTLLTIATAAVLGAATLFQAPAGAQQIAGLTPASPQPGDGDLKPGLAVSYITGFKFNHIEEMKQMAQYNKPSPGEPLPMLNYHVGRGLVLTSKYDNLVGAFIDGYIKFPEAGDYTFWVHSNDGVELNISGKLVYTLPDVHPDTMSEAISVKIDEPGWYPLNVLYYEKKNTSTLELYWQKPGDSAKDFVAAEYFGHK